MKVKTRKNCTYPMHLVGTVAVFDDFKEMPSSVKFITGMEKHEQLELSSVDIWLYGIESHDATFTSFSRSVSPYREQ